MDDVVGAKAAADDKLTAHTDGACSGNPGPAGWAVVFSRGGVIVGEHSGREDRGTNNRAELAAVALALKLAPAGEHVEVATDSLNVIGWLSKGWKRKVPEIAAACREIDGLMRRPGGVSFVHVRGHQGHALNERADVLAVMASKGSVVGGA